MRFLLFLPLVISLIGCNTVYRPWLKSTYQMSAPVQLDVVSVDVNNLYVNQTREPNVETQVDPTPDLQIISWVQNYMRAAGESGRAIVTIEEASLVKDIARNSSADRPNSMYIMTIELKIEVLDRRGGSRGYTRVRGQRSHELPDNFTNTEKQEAWRIMLEELFGGLEISIRNNISNNIPSVIRTS